MLKCWRLLLCCNQTPASFKLCLHSQSKISHKEKSKLYINTFNNTVVGQPWKNILLHCLSVCLSSFKLTTLEFFPTNQHRVVPQSEAQMKWLIPHPVPPLRPWMIPGGGSEQQRNFDRQLKLKTNFHSTMLVGRLDISLMNRFYRSNSLQWILDNCSSEITASQRTYALIVRKQTGAEYCLQNSKTKDRKYNYRGIESLDN